MSSCPHSLLPALRLAAPMLMLVFGARVPPAEGSPETYADPRHDATLRRTDPGADGPFDPLQHQLIDLLNIRLGRWAAPDPASDRFTGSFSEAGEFARLDVELAGVVNPGGSVAAGAFDPFAYGPNPVYGFLEFDLDRNKDTGGELDSPAYRYLANAARFGGFPPGSTFHGRAANEGEDLDASFITAPWVERSGEEFHLALLGGMFLPSDVTEVAGDADAFFEAGETWDIAAPWFHRAHGFEPYSLAQGGAAAGEYMPPTVLRFRHDPGGDTTLLSLIFPLTNAASAALRGETPEPDNFDPSDQASVHEALADLVLSAEIVAEFGTGEPEEALILPWRFGVPEDGLDPDDWRVTALLGTSYTAPEPAGAYFIWTDIFPNDIRGDVNGEAGADHEDREKILDFVDDHDADDGLIDGVAWVEDLGPNFVVYDVNQDGRVDATDVLLVSEPGDDDADGDVDLADYAHLQACVYPDAPANDAACALDDLNLDGQVGLWDLYGFIQLLTGP